ncbi:hypothetical protein RHSIM_Rhsim09G0071500 [Rhododendron simsii]|uniref:Uncharacterized protein n=1 Tax=Rhododendron simsii TaxID=118357 RepID=A0A834GH31_RHOSS|nr:hypothetical protein RHSIM_Rhsim09G0071500 [Rhododendron simsii]
MIVVRTTPSKSVRSWSVSCCDKWGQNRALDVRILRFGGSLRLKLEICDPRTTPTNRRSLARGLARISGNGWERAKEAPMAVDQEAPTIVGGVDEKEEKITSRLEKKTVLVTPTIIAKYLKNYQRPSHRSTTYPEHGWSKTEEEIQNALTNKPMKQDRFVHGRLFEKYRVINKVVHYNLCPHSSEKLPRREDGEVIFVFGSSDEVVDWALLIWKSMVRFKKRTAPSKPNIPFPAMVTALCESQGVLVPERLLPGSPGPITGGSLEKSKSLSQPPLPDSFGFPTPTAKSQSGRIEEYTRIMATQLHSMQMKQNKLETQMRRTRRDVSAIKRGMLWIAARCGKEGDVYTPTEADMRESTPEEPEIDHGAGTSGGESSTRRRGKEHAIEHDDTDESDDEEDD